MKSRPIFTYLCLGLCLMVFIFVTLIWGETPWSLVWQGAYTRITGVNHDWNPLLDERLPRIIVLLCTGASLAVSGAVMQSLFHNPLASPSILGISCGGSLFVVIAFVFGWQLEYPYIIPVAAVSGCLLVLLLIFFLTRNFSEMSLTPLVLTGIALSTLLIAIQGAILYALRDNWQLIQTLTEWEAGSTIDRSWKHVHMQLPLTIIGLTGCWIYRQELNILTLGEEEARNLGVEVKQVRWRLFLFVALLTGGALAAVGMIAFFGLVLPHLVRKLQGPCHQHMITLCIFFGGIALLGMDLLLRLFDIHTFSIGNVSAILGGLFFLTLLFGSRRQNYA